MSLERNRHYWGLLKAKAVYHTASTGNPHARTLHKEVSFICNRNKHPLPRSPPFWRSDEKISRTSSFDRNAAVLNAGSHESPASTASEGIGWRTTLAECTDSILHSSLGKNIWHHFPQTENLQHDLIPPVSVFPLEDFKISAYQALSSRVTWAAPIAAQICRQAQYSGSFRVAP